MGRVGEQPGALQNDFRLKTVQAERDHAATEIISGRLAYHPTTIEIKDPPHDLERAPEVFTREPNTPRGAAHYIHHEHNGVK